MIFKSPKESAELLAQKIKEEDLSNPTLTYVTEDSFDFAMDVANVLNLRISNLSKLLLDTPTINVGHNLIIIDSGVVRGSEYTEYADKIRKTFPQTVITIAVPVIPQAEEAIFKSDCDRLVVLHTEPLFFSLSQFYQNPN
jgi:predicted phosphoribosyltransferase